MKDWLILLCIGIIAFLAFHERDRWLPPSAAPAPSAVPKTQTASAELPAKLVGIRPGPNPSTNVALATLVTQSQREALAKYPALGVANSELNIRFAFRYKRLLAEHSPRLEDPSWPVQLADECAQDSNVHPAMEPPAGAPKTVSVPPGAGRPAGTPAPSLRLSQAVPATTDTLVFHPVKVSGPSTSVAAAPTPVAAPKLSGALPFVTMDPVNRSSANNYTYNWGSYYGWYDISFRQSVGISIKVKNMARTAEEVNLRWIFFARHPNNTRFVFAAAGKALDLTPGQTEDVSADSPLIQSREINYGWVGERYLSGSKYEGWLVQLLERGSNRIIKQTGSTGYLEDLARKTDFASMIDDYRSKVQGQGSTGL